MKSINTDDYSVLENRVKLLGKKVEELESENRRLVLDNYHLGVDIKHLIMLTEQKSFKMPSGLSREERRAWAKSNKFGTEHRIPLSDRISLTRDEIRDQGLVCLQAYTTTDVESIDIDSFIDISIVED